MHVLIVGAALAAGAALSLHAAGIGATVFEQVQEPGTGCRINTLPHAIKELANLGLLPALTAPGSAPAN